MSEQQYQDQTEPPMQEALVARFPDTAERESWKQASTRIRVENARVEQRRKLYRSTQYVTRPR